MVSNKLNVLIKPHTLCGCLIFAGMLLIGCSNNHEARMQKLRGDHQARYMQELAAQRDSLLWADSMQMCIAPIINQLIEQTPFEYVTDKFAELGRYYPKGSDAASNLSRSYLHASVNDYGIVQLISEYRGAHPINHTQIMVEGADGTQVRSQVVSLDRDGANHRFNNQDLYHETVTFVSDSVLLYIAAHASDKRIKCTQLGAKGAKFSFYISSKEINQLKQSYLLGEALATQIRSSQTAKVAAEKIQVLETKLELQK